MKRIPIILLLLVASPLRSPTLAWDNSPTPFPELWTTGLEASTNLVTWTVVWLSDYVLHPVATLTNRPSFEFYRAFNAVKN